VMADSASGPLSHAQERLLLSEHFLPGMAGNIVVHARWLRGPLDLAALRTAISEVMRRHPSLRTVYGWDQDWNPRQRVLQPGEWPDPLEVAAAPPTDDDTADDEAGLAREMGQDWWDQPFELDRGPAFRVRVVTVRPDLHLLYLGFHHIACDGWSARIVGRDIAVAYEAAMSGLALPCGPLADYQTYVRRERLQMRGWMDEDVPFWRTRLAGRSPLQAGHGDYSEKPAVEYTASVPGLSTSALSGLGRRERLAVVLHGAAQVLGECLGETWVCLGTLTSGRADKDFRSVVGSFTNPIVVPIERSGRTAGTGWRQTRQTLADCLRHARTPFDEIVRVLPRLEGDRTWPGVIVSLHDWTTFAPVQSAIDNLPTVLTAPRTPEALALDVITETGQDWAVRARWQEGVVSASTGCALAERIALALREAS
jgi:mycobactin peptide synthetase MbtE